MFFLMRFYQIYQITEQQPMIFPVGETFKSLLFRFSSLRTEQLILHEKTEAQHTVPQPALGRTRSSSRALLVPAVRFPPLAARWSPSMRRERQIHIRVFPLTFHWLPQPLGLRAELLPEPVRTVGSSQTQKGAGFGFFC